MAAGEPRSPVVAPRLRLPPTAESRSASGYLESVTLVAFSSDGGQPAVVGFFRVTFWNVRDRPSPRQHGVFAPASAVHCPRSPTAPADAPWPWVPAAAASTWWTSPAALGRPTSNTPATLVRSVRWPSAPTAIPWPPPGRPRRCGGGGAADPKQGRPIGRPLAGVLNEVGAVVVARLSGRGVGYVPMNGTSVWVKSQVFCVMPEQSLEPVLPGQAPLS